MPTSSRGWLSATRWSFRIWRSGNPPRVRFRVIASRTHTFLQFARYLPDTIEFFDIGNHLELAGLILARPQFDTRERVLTFNVETNKATYLAANGDMPGMAEPAVAARIKAQTASAERLGI